MILQSGFIAIKNITFDTLGEVFSKFRLIDTKNDKLLSSFTQVEEIIENKLFNPGDYRQRRIVWSEKDWIVIEDTSFLLCSNENALQEIAKEFKTKVYSFSSNETSSSYGFIYATENHFRSFAVKDEKIVRNIGEQLEAEEQFRLNEQPNYNDILTMFKKLGLDWEEVPKATKFIVKELENSEELNEEIMKIMDSSGLSKVQEQKPWWKFW